MRHSPKKPILAALLILIIASVVYFVPYIGARRGGPIYNDPWTGAVAPALDYLKKNLKEPDSLEVIEWGKVKKAGTGYSVRCEFRARNSFGGYNVQTEVFLFNKDGWLISTAPLN